MPRLRITKLADTEYLIAQVALGIDDYYLGVGEAPGVWQGDLADELGLSGVVDADHLRALLLGRHPGTDADTVKRSCRRRCSNPSSSPSTTPRERVERNAESALMPSGGL
jgi:hypothetical protein